MLAGVHAESLHANVHQVVEIIRDLAAHIILAAVQVVQAHQVAVSHLPKEGQWHEVAWAGFSARINLGTLILNLLKNS